MRKSIIKRLIEEGSVDTRKYRYILYNDYLIKRAPIDSVEYPDAWEVVYDFTKEA